MQYGRYRQGEIAQAETSQRDCAEGCDNPVEQEGETMKIDDLKTRQHIILTGPAQEPHECPPWPHSHPPRDKTLGFVGTPLKVVAINLPFVAVSVDDEPSFALDIRKYRFERANKQYVREFQYSLWQAHEMMHGPCHHNRVAPPKAESCCPGCGGKLVQRRVGESKWAFRCRECDA